MTRVVAIAAVLAVALAAAAGAAPRPRASLLDVEDEVMCLVCGTPLNVALEAPEAKREVAFIQAAIARGETKEQIKRGLVAQYGPQVLAVPERKGFDLAAYLVPILAVLAALWALAFALPRWRRRGRDRRRPSKTDPAASPLRPSDARRLDEDLARHPG